MKKCEICNKNIAVMYTSKIEDGKTHMTGMCMECAKKLGIPVADEILKQMNLKPEDIENLTEQMSHMFDDMDDEDGNPFEKMMNGIGSDDETEDEFEEEAKDDVKVKDKKANSNKKLKTLEKYATNLIDKANEGEIDKIIGRHDEIDRVIQILNRRNKNNPILIGEPGVGKTAIAEGLAVRIVEKSVPEKLLNTQIYLLDLTAIVAGTQFRGQFEGRMKSIIKEASQAGNVVLVIDEVHNIMGAGEVHGGVMNAANILKPALAKGEIQIIGATTLEEYRKHIEKDAALERRFQPVIVDEPTVEESIEILKGIKHYYENFHKVEISDEIVVASVKMSKRYITDRYLPDKAIDIIDEAGSRANLRNHGLVDLQSLKNKLLKVQEAKEIASSQDDFQKAAEHKIEELGIMNRIKELEKSTTHIGLSIEDVAHVIEAWTKIPVKNISEEEAEKLINLEQRIHHRLVGQNPAVTTLAKAIRRNRSGFKKRKKPASFIFVGPTGVGKTELARTLAVELFGSEEHMIRLDMSEYMEKHTVSKLIGAPPGYVGFDNGGQLTEKIRRKPYSVILMDEIEKAHPDVFNMLLQILEDGRLTDSQGRTAFFENSVIIMTSNAGTTAKSYNIGFGMDAYQAMEDKVRDELKSFFRPEFLNRVDDIIVFDHLKKEELNEIIDIMVEEISEDAKDKHISITITDNMKSKILESGYDEKYGARPLRRAIQNMVEDEVAEKYIRKEIIDGDDLLVDYVDGEVVITVKGKVNLDK